MKKEELKIWYEKNKLNPDDLAYAVDTLTDFEKFLVMHKSTTLDDLSIDDLDALIQYLVHSNQNNVKNFIVLMRYFKMIHLHDHFIQLTKYTGAIGVVESILSKLARIANPLTTKEIMDQIKPPVLGTDLHEITHFTVSFITLLEEKLSERELRLVLADNHHQIPKEAFIEEKVYYESAPTLEAYLKDLHQRKVTELTDFYNAKKVWYEQEITEDVINYVKSNQEIMSAVLKDDALYITKIPYDTKKYLNADTIDEQAYYLCHCPFAREALKHKEIISKNWCYCSGGFTKFPFDIIFNQSLEIELLESALHLDGACRFKIDLKNVDYKR
ncbi:MAG: hypothetical protein EP317_04835 [Bacillota bacterium]|nr:MAG: hypothetical protein EP317_04835 [Bacillota bacterium]